MRLLLVNTNTCRDPYPVAPLGVCLLASALRDEAEVRVFDGTFRGSEGLRETVEDFRPDLVGLSVRNVDDLVPRETTFFLDEIRRAFVNPLREATGAPLVLGGSAFSLFPLELMRAWQADYGIVGEGEEALRTLVRTLEHGGDPRRIPGLLVAGDREVPAAPRRPAPGPLRIPFSEVDRHIDFGPYRHLGSYPIQARRGCTHRCIYCTYPALEGRRHRLRDPEEIAREIAEAADRIPGVTFEFVDSTFNDPRGHAEAICRALIRRDLRVRLRTMGVNPGHVTDELLDLMQQAGFAQIDCTPDSASPTMIRAMGKNSSPEDLVRTARGIRRRGMPTAWFFLFGGPGETAGTIRETMDFIDREVSPEDLVLMGIGLRIYPGTPLHRTAIREGIVSPEEDLVRPRFYVAPDLGYERIRDTLEEAAAVRPHCLPPGENRPSPEMLRQAVAMRRDQGLTEPMFRTLLRIRRSWPRFAGIAAPGNAPVPSVTK